MKSPESLYLKQFNPYDLNEIADLLEMDVRYRPFSFPQKDKTEIQKNEIIKKGIFKMVEEKSK